MEMKMENTFDELEASIEKTGGRLEDIATNLTKCDQFSEAMAGDDETEVQTPLQNERNSLAEPNPGCSRSDSIPYIKPKNRPEFTTMIKFFINRPRRAERRAERAKRRAERKLQRKIDNKENVNDELRHVLIEYI